MSKLMRAQGCFPSATPLNTAGSTSSPRCALDLAGNGLASLALRRSPRAHAPTMLGEQAVSVLEAKPFRGLQAATASDGGGPTTPGACSSMKAARSWPLSAIGSSSHMTTSFIRSPTVGIGRVPSPRGKAQDDHRVFGESPVEQSGHVFGLMLLPHLELVLLSAAIAHSESRHGSIFPYSPGSPFEVCTRRRARRSSSLVPVRLLIGPVFQRAILMRRRVSLDDQSRLSGASLGYTESREAMAQGCRTCDRLAPEPS
jgi:hypothetical protein